MDELLDQEKKPYKAEINHKRINTSFLLIPPVFVLITIASVVYDQKLIVSPFVPKYAAINANASIINYTVILVLSLIPALYLRIGKHYKQSTLVIFIFVLLGLIVKNWVAFHELLY